MREERLFILKMLEEGKINAKEAAALLEALDAGGRETVDKPGESAGGVAGASNGAEHGQNLEQEKEQEPEEGQRQKQQQQHQAGAASGNGEGAEAKRRHNGFEYDRSWSEFSRDLAQQIREAVQTAMRGVPQIKEELKENLHEVREELEQTFKEVREEMRKGPLVDVSGLRNVLSHIFVRWPSQEVRDELKGVWAQGARPRVELRTKNGSVTVTGWDEPHYWVTVRKSVYASSEEEARKLSADAVRVTSSEYGLEVTCRDDHRVNVSVEAKLPKGFVYDLIASSTNGAVTVEGVRVSGAVATTTNGAVRVREISGDKADVSSTNGRISCEEVHVKELEASTTNGGVSWTGTALTAKLRTTNGSIRLAPELPPTPVRSGEEGTQEVVSAHYIAETTNAGIHVKLPADPGLGVRFESRARSVDLGADDGHFIIGSQSRDHGWHFVSASTPGYEGAPRRMVLNLKTTNGTVRLESTRPHRGESREPLHEDAN